MTQRDREDGKGVGEEPNLYKSFNTLRISEGTQEGKNDKSEREGDGEREVEGPISRFSSRECRITIKTWPNSPGPTFHG
jgi:hypothetical protein